MTVLKGDDVGSEQQFFVEIRRAVARGFTLAAASAALACGTPTTTPDSGVTVVDAGEPPAVRDPDGGLLAQVPADSLRCTGDAGSPGPFFGACCTRLHCYSTAEATCDAVLSWAREFSPSLPGSSSGNCSCGEPTGPFASPDGGAHECCFVVGSIACLGRPLREGEAMLVAAVVARPDWA